MAAPTKLDGHEARSLASRSRAKTEPIGGRVCSIVFSLLPQATGSRGRFSLDNSNDETLIESSLKQLDRVLGFFPRVDSKTTAVLGIDIAMLGFLAINAPKFQLWSWVMLVAIVPLAFIGFSLYYIYVCSFPHLEGGHDSLIYFREIAKRTESQYIALVRERKTDAFLNDVLGQVWRNSEILRKKYDSIRFAHNWLVAALIPWIATLFVFAAISNANGGLFH
jgi:hypothetical protein